MTRFSISRADVLLIVTFLVIAFVVIFRINIEGTSYLCPDSKAYIGLAQNIKDGYGFHTIDPITQERRYFSIWPVGYPILITLFSTITGIGVFWSSKLMGLFFMALAFLLFRHLNREYSFVLASVFGAYTYLEVYSYSWSETPFLPGLLLLAFLSNQVWIRKNLLQNSILIFVTCIALFLLRYVGAFSFAIPGFFALYFMYKSELKPAIGFLVITALLAILAGAYLYTNFLLSGYAAGFERIDEGHIEPLRFMLMLLKGILNEVLIIREFRLANQPDFLLYITIILQYAVMYYVTRVIKMHFNYWQALKNQSLSLICIGIGLLYFISILSLRVLSHFDDLYYRFMAPLSLMVFTAFIYTFICLPDQNREVVRAKYLVFGFFLLSALINVPKKFVLNQLQWLF